MILVISTCKEKLHEFEFVKPIENILKINKIKFFTRHYKKLADKDIANSKMIIICGTSLKDNSFFDDIGMFEFLKKYRGKVLGICSGMHILGLVFNGKKVRKKQIGEINAEFKNSFLGIKGRRKVYSLHGYYVKSKSFDYFADDQAMKHKTKHFYGVLFHPEV